jgi:hypothetical protein
MGMVGFFARFIPGYSDIAAAVHNLKRKGVSFVGTEEQQRAFDKLKQALCKAPVLLMTDFVVEYIYAFVGVFVGKSMTSQ